MNRENKKGLFIVGTIILLILAGFTFLILRFFNPTQEEITNDTYEISSTDILSIQSLNEILMNSVGNFGVISDTINPQNVSTIKRDIEDNNSNEFISRENAYYTIRDFIKVGSPAFYDSSITDNWDTFTPEKENLMGYTIDSFEFIPNDKGELIQDGDSTYAFITGTLTFSSTITMFVPTADDSGWDGSYYKNSLSSNNNSVTLSFIKDNSEWLLYSADNFTNPYLLALWKNPDYETFYKDFSSDFTSQEVIHPSNN